MTQALCTVIADVEAGKVPALQELIAHRLGNPALSAIQGGLSQLDEEDEESGTHFASLHAIPDGLGSRGYLILEFSADGTDEKALRRLDRQIGPYLTDIFAHASDWSRASHWRSALDWSEDGDLLNYLRRHVVQPGHGLFDSPGLCFAGTPGVTVGRIRKERDLAARVAKLLGEQQADLRAIDRLAAVRAAIARDKDFAWALGNPGAQPPKQTSTIVAIVPQLALSFARTFLWPLGLVLAAWVISAAVTAHSAVPLSEPPFWPVVGAAVSALWSGLIAALIFVVIVGVIVYLSLRRQEGDDWVDERWSDLKTLDEILRRENAGAQNHMASVTRRKPGLVRWFTIRLVFWVIAEFAARVYRTGFLSDIGSIHFARWITVPGTRDFMFFSNYGGSWESYLEDFITRAHFGLTGVWSNAIGFPRTRNLIQGGASDGERFKRYARRSMVPTPFWYSAYRDTTTSHIRTNAAIRRGLASALSNEEAVDWLALFGSAARPDAKMEASDIQSLVFGGLGFLPFGVCLLYRLSSDRRQAQEFLKLVTPHVAFNDGRRLPVKNYAAVILGLGPEALAKLGLPEDCVSGFPAAFLGGMAARARILGDIDENAVDNWLWGAEEKLDLAMLIYGTSAEAVDDLKVQIDTWAQPRNCIESYRIDLQPVDETGKKTEPFGFVDGVSQPVIRGTYKSLRRPDSIHVVAPGEFLLGYPDNRGNIPPGPTLSPLLDPHNRLPIAEQHQDFACNIVNATRELARNGTFLVIRQLAQDVDGFWTYCREEAARLEHRLGPPYRVDSDFIAAKLVGRWPDGSSLVRNPYKPVHEAVSGEERLRAIGQRIEPSRKLVSESADGLLRPTTDPPSGSPIEGSPKPSRPADNDFLFGEEDPEALRCPFGAHIRRANPRDSFLPGSREQIEISNRHRILRVGRFYEPQPGQKPGLLFMCLNGDIERQFEFVQQTWLNSPSFHGLSGEQDPLLGGEKSCTGFMVPSRDGPVRLSPLQRFVTVLGGGYFFLPGKRLLNYLGGDE
jgi:deferrochelatase/peroxidase EfeB